LKFSEASAGEAIEDAEEFVERAFDLIKKGRK
jgi:hypothetical protein